MVKQNKYLLLKSLDRDERVRCQLGIREPPKQQFVDKASEAKRKSKSKKSKHKSQKLKSVVDSARKAVAIDPLINPEPKSGIKLKSSKVDSEEITSEVGIAKQRKRRKRKLDVGIEKNNSSDKKSVDDVQKKIRKSKFSYQKIKGEQDHIQLNGTPTLETDAHTTKRPKKKKNARTVKTVVNKEEIISVKDRKKRIDILAEDDGCSISSVSLSNNDVQSEGDSAENNAQSLRDKLTEKLKGARFRFISENLYTTTSAEARQMFEADPNLFKAYHEGYYIQKSTWPNDPIEILVKQLKKLSEKTVIADMGCGDARLASALPKHQMHSFDLVALNDKVTVCDMSKVPLDAGTVDICVFCLSLMGTNLSDYILEANRILKMNGTLKIIEIASRFISIKDFRRSLQKLGFVFTKQSQPNDYFVQLDFEKTGKPINKRPPGLKLNPCLYKKR